MTAPASKTGGPDSGKRPRLIRCLRLLAPWGAALLTAAAALRFGLRDTSALSAPLFYALPLPVQAAGWLLLMLIWWPLKALRCLTLAAALGTAAWWSLASWQRLPLNAPASSAGEEVTVLFWNIGHRTAPPPRLLELLRTRQPDFAALAESEELPPDARDQLTAALPGSQLLRLPDGMIALVRGSIQLTATHALPQKSSLHLTTVTLSRLPALSWQFILADIGPWPPLPRTHILDAMRALLSDSPRTLIAGDFNTPFDSAAFDPWRTRFRHGLAHCPAFTGPLETWGAGLPLLAIDHQWCSPDLQPAAAEKAWELPLDHQWLLIRYLAP